MIEISGQAYALNDPLVLATLAAAGLLLLVVILLVVTLNRAGRSAAAAEPLIYQMNQLGQRVQMLSDGQQQLAGGLTHVSEAQAASQANMLKLMESRLQQVTDRLLEPVQDAVFRKIPGREIDRLHAAICRTMPVVQMRQE